MQLPLIFRFSRGLGQFSAYTQSYAIFEKKPGPRCFLFLLPIDSSHANVNIFSFLHSAQLTFHHWWCTNFGLQFGILLNCLPLFFNFIIAVILFITDWNILKHKAWVMKNPVLIWNRYCRTNFAYERRAGLEFYP